MDSWLREPERFKCRTAGACQHGWTYCPLCGGCWNQNEVEECQCDDDDQREFFRKGLDRETQK